MNLIALLSKFSHIWEIRSQSPCTHKSGSTSSNTRITPGWTESQYWWYNRAHMSLILTDPIENFSDPASKADKSRMSLKRFSSKPEFFSIISAYWDCSSLSPDSMISFEKPTIAFKGVRISWLILARKEDFSLSASSALTLASISSFSVFLISVISHPTPTI